MKEKNKKVNGIGRIVRVGRIGLVLTVLGIVFAVAVIAMAADADADGSSVWTGGYPKPVTRFNEIFADTTPELNTDSSAASAASVASDAFKKRIVNAGVNVGANAGAGKSVGYVGSDGKFVTGTWINYVQGVTGKGRITGAYAGQEINPLHELNADGFLYDPTLKVPGAPVESTTAYIRFGGSTDRIWAVWDFYIGNFMIHKNLSDPRFLGAYVRTFNEGKLYFTEMIKIGRTWYVLLYNFNTGKWEKQYSALEYRKPDNLGGWDVAEFHLNGCAFIPEAESTELKVYDSGGFYKNQEGKIVRKKPGWYYVTPEYGQLMQSYSEIEECGYSGKMMIPYYHWQVSGPDVIALVN